MITNIYNTSSGTLPRIAFKSFIFIADPYKLPMKNSDNASLSTTVHSTAVTATAGKKFVNYNIVTQLVNFHNNNLH